ncbi:uncharacterized protein LOC110032953 isoform X2 [Phalaenopsis equestris]|uniref:uncharacterized protein LOC110032953 isoform X2 n=1 Tax=Phalaenopsis equestris TaxID=78828 RepID=UPI0009E63174|nr:uncharacterized protein LOC110032953 isoform X2 [Phalaenopsis equestris]
MNSIALPWPFGRGSKLGKPRKEEEKVAQLEEFGVTQQLLAFLKDFTVDTFKNFPLKDDPSADGDVGTSGSSLSKDLSEWQERHALLLLTKATEISRIRYALCPRFLKDKQFWRIYFHLVKNYVAPYEKRAIQKDMIKKHLENDKFCDKAAVEVEMMESKLPCYPQTVLHASESGGEGTDESPHGNLPSV